MHAQLLVHGGAGPIAADNVERNALVRISIDQALDAGCGALDKNALAGAECAVQVLEDAQTLNAGRGSALTSEGRVEMDAAIMDGHGRKFGAATGLTTTRHAISAARMIMEHSPSKFLAGRWADQLAASYELEQVDNEWFITEARQRAFDQGAADDIVAERGTVGAVTCDNDGRICAATSTGGLWQKPPGRIGDTPVIGAGTFADKTSCAVSVTGDGEALLALLPASTTAFLIEHLQCSLKQAAERSLDPLVARASYGGLIAITPTGSATALVVGGQMHWGAQLSDGTRAYSAHLA